jgi:hypothetical protein
MAKFKSAGRRAAVITCIVAVTCGVTPLAAGAASSSHASPDVPGCIAGYFYVASNHSQTNEGKGLTTYLYNNNASTVSLTASFDSSTTVNYSATVEATAEINDVIASISTNYSVTVGRSSSESYNASATVSNVPVGKYGVIQLGAAYWNTSGTYEYQSATCQYSNQSSESARFPEAPNSVLILTGISSSESQPWPQTN